MKKFKKIILIILIVISSSFMFCGCDINATNQDIQNTFDIGNNLAENQPTPTDLDYSLERYNLIRRAYWVNGQRAKAIALPCEIVRPLGYIILFGGSGAILGIFVVDGKVSSLNSWLTPDEWYRYFCEGGSTNIEMPDVDGSYGTNVDGIFFFTPDGKYLEWTGDFLYSDIPFVVDDPILIIDNGGDE